MGEIFFKIEQLKGDALIEGYFLQSDINKRERFLQRRLSQKKRKLRSERSDLRNGGR